MFYRRRIVSLSDLLCSHVLLNRLRITYNNSMRRLFNLHYRCSASAMFVYMVIFLVLVNYDANIQYV